MQWGGGALEEIPKGVLVGGTVVRTPGKPWAVRAQQARLGRWGGTGCVCVVGLAGGKEVLEVVS